VTDLSKPPRPDEIMRSLAKAIRERRFEYIQPLLSVLARTAPAKAEVVYEAILAALPESRAVVAQGSLFDQEAS
jgi:hypothetical protein